jgi:hypothetical protein
MEPAAVDSVKNIAEKVKHVALDQKPKGEKKAKKSKGGDGSSAVEGGGSLEVRVSNYFFLSLIQRFSWD